LLYTFLLLSALTIMNMLIGVICEVVSAVAATEREQMNLAEVRDKIRELLAVGDANQDNMISKAEFMVLLTNKTAAAILTGVGVDVFELVDFSDYIFTDDEKELSFADLMNLVLDLRGSNTATVKDIVDLRRFVKLRFSEMEEALSCSSVIPNGPRTCTSAIATTHEDQLQVSSKCGGRAVAPKQDKLMSMLSLGARDSSPKFKHLVESSLSVLLSEHDNEMAAMRAEIVCLRQSLCIPQALNISRQVSPDEVQLAKSCAHGTSIPSRGESNSSAGSKESQVSRNRHGSFAGRESSDTDTPRPVARSAWDPPDATAAESHCRPAGFQRLPSARVVPVTSQDNDMASSRR